MQNLLSFQPQATDQSLLFIFPNGDLLNRKTVASMLKALTKKCGLAKGRYKAHSFRKGATSTLAAAGIPDSTIQTMGRWSTDCYKIYINLSQSQISNFAKALCVVGSSPWDGGAFQALTVLDVSISNPSNFGAISYILWSQYLSYIPAHREEKRIVSWRCIRAHRNIIFFLL